MKRFDNQDDDWQDDNLFHDMDDDDDDDDEEMSDDDYALLLAQKEEFDLRQLKLAQVELNQRLLFKVMGSLRKSWFWRFRSPDSKLRLIVTYYNMFKELVNIEE